MPWYRNADLPHFYYVAEVCADLRPSDPFPDDEYASFNDYFMHKYGIEIYNQHQPLLDVDYTSNRSASAYLCAIAIGFGLASRLPSPNPK